MLFYFRLSFGVYVARTLGIVEGGSVGTVPLVELGVTVTGILEETFIFAIHL